MPQEWRQQLARGLAIALVTGLLLAFGVWQGRRLSANDAEAELAARQAVAAAARAPVAPPAAAAPPGRAVVNGADALVESGASDRTCAELIRGYQARYRGQAMLSSLTPDEQAERGLVDGMLVVHADGYSMLGFIDAKGASIGVVAFAGPEGKGCRYHVYKSKDALRQVPTELAGGDAPGDDPPDCPRPPASTRVLAVAPDPAGGEIFLYETPRSAGEVARFYRDRMPPQGWSQASGAAAEALAFDRPGRQCLVSTEEDPGAGRTFVTLVYRRFADGPAPGPR